MVLGLASVAGASAATDRLVTALGRGGVVGKGTTNEVVVEQSSPGFVSFRVVYERSGAKGWAGPRDPVAVAPRGWAFCVSDSEEVWFYDGNGNYRLYVITAKSVTCADSAMEPDLGARAPERLRAWVAAGKR